jgi:hypothetical protein
VAGRALLGSADEAYNRYQRTRSGGWPVTDERGLYERPVPGGLIVRASRG